MTRTLKQDEKEFLWNIFIKGCRQLHNGYMTYVYKRKRYRRSRVLYQLFNNVYLYQDEIIHHKNRNKEDDHLTNLELIDSYDHKSLHNKDMRIKHKKRIKTNKLDKFMIDKIKYLRDCHLEYGKVNYSKIAKELGISDETIRRYCKE